MGTILLIILIVLLVGGLPQLSGHAYGYWPSGTLGLVLLILVILILLGRL
jgi:hypothetical protein